MSGQVLPLQGAWQRSSSIEERKRAERELAEIQQREEQKALAAKRKQLTTEVDPSLVGGDKLNIDGMSESDAQAALSQAIADFEQLCELRNHQPLTESDALVLSEYMKVNRLDVFSVWEWQRGYDALVQHGIISKPTPKPTEKPAATEPSNEDKAQADANTLAFLNHSRTNELANPERRAVVDAYVRETFGQIGRQFFADAAATRSFSLSESDFTLLQNFMRSRNLNFADPSHLDKACRALFPTEYLTPREKKIRELDQRMEKLDSRSATYHEDFKAIRRAYAELDREAQ